MENRFRSRKRTSIKELKETTVEQYKARFYIRVLEDDNYTSKIDNFMMGSSWFDVNFGSRERRNSTIFFTELINKIAKVKRMPHVKLTYSKVILAKKKYRQKL